MAEALLELDINPALASVEELGASIEDTLGSAANDVSSALDDAFSGFDTGDIGDQLSSMEEDLGGVADSAGQVTEQMDLASVAAGAFSTSSQVLSGNLGSLVTGLIPKIGIFAGLTLAIGNLVEKGHAAELAAERMNRVFGDLAPTIFDGHIQDINRSLRELDAQAGNSNSKLGMAVATFGQTALGAGATAEESANVSQQMGVLANIVSVLNPSLGTADAVFQTMTRGLGGSTRILQRYGITIDAAEQSTRALAIAHEHGRDKVTLYDKQVAGAELAMEGFKKQAEAAGMSLDEWLNQALENSTVKSRSLKQEVSSALGGIGKAIAPAGTAILEAMQPITLGIINAFGTLVKQIVPIIAPLADSFSAAITPAIDAIPGLLEPLAPLWETLGTILGTLIDIIAPLLDWVVKLAGAFVAVSAPFIIEFFKGMATGLGEVRDVLADVTAWLGEQFGGVLERLRPVLGDTTDKIKEIGLELSGSFGRAAGIVLGVAAALWGVHAAMKAITTIASGVQTAFTLIATHPIIAILVVLVGTFILLYEHSETFRRTVDDLANTFTEKVLPVLEDVGNVLIDKVGKAIQDVGAWVRDDLVPFVRDDLVPALEKLADWGKKAFDETKKAAEELWNSNTMQLIRGVVSDINGAFVDLTASTTGLNGPMATLTGTMVTLTAPVTGTALAIGFLYAKWDAFNDVVDEFASEIWPTLQQVWNSLSEAVGKLVNTVEELAPHFQRIWDRLKEVATVVGGVLYLVLTPILRLIKAQLGPAFEYLRRTVETVFKMMERIISGALKVITGVIELFLDFITGHWGNLWNDVKLIIEGAWEIIKGIVVGAVESIWNMLRLFVDTAWQLLQAGWDLILEAIGWVWDKAKELFNAAKDKLIEIVTNLVDKVVEFFTALPGRVVDGLGDLGTFIWNAITTGFEFLKTQISQATDKIVDFFAQLPGRVVGALGDIGTFIWNAITSGFEFLKTQISNAIDSIVTFFSELPGKAISALGDLGGAIWGAITSGIDTLKTNVSGAVDNIVGFFTDAPGKIVSAFDDLGGKVWNAIKSAWNWAMDKAGDVIGLPKTVDLNGPIPGGDVTIPNPFSALKVHSGGVVPGMMGDEVPATLLAGERVLSPDQTRAFERLVDMLERGGMGNGTPAVGQMNIYGNRDPRVTADVVNRRLGRAVGRR